MRTKIVVILSLLSILTGAVNAFAQSSETAPEPTVQTSAVHRFANAAQVVDAHASLARYDNGVKMALATNGLVPDEMYTVWWVIFNAPENCSGVCDADDVFEMYSAGIPRDADGNINFREWEARRWSVAAEVVRDAYGNRILNTDGIAAASVSVVLASRSVTADGTLAISASMPEGMTPGAAFGPGLMDAQNAEIHLVVSTHGTADAEMFASQLAAFQDGCDSMDTDSCEAVQYARFAPLAE